MQDISQNNSNSFFFTKDLNIYSFIYFDKSEQFFEFVDKNEIKASNFYINYYKTNPSGSYLNFISNREFIYSYILYNDLRVSTKMNISQIKGSNKLKISINSYSYYSEQPFKYYLFINTPNDLVYINSFI